MEKEATLPKLTGALDYNALQVLYYRCKVRDGLTVLQIHSYEGTTSAIKNYHGIFNLKKHCDDKLTASEFQSIQSRDRSASSKILKKLLPSVLFYTLFFLTHEVRSHCAFFSYALKGRKYPMSTGKRGLDKKQGNQVTIMVNHNSFSVKGLVRKTLLLSFVSCIHQILEHEIVENKEPQGFKGFSEKNLKIQLH